MPAEFKVPPPSQKRKLVVEFPDDYGSPDTPSYKFWLEVDRLWVLASREHQEALSLVVATVENVSDAWKVNILTAHSFLLDLSALS